MCTRGFHTVNTKCENFKSEYNRDNGNTHMEDWHLNYYRATIYKNALTFYPIATAMTHEALTTMEHQPKAQPCEVGTLGTTTAARTGCRTLCSRVTIVCRHASLFSPYLTLKRRPLASHQRVVCKFAPL